ncbi:hypothetical protein LTR17_027729, partial [Elasticomyces elasticus]
AGTAACLHVEDRGLASMNINVASEAKIWLYIPPHQRDRLEAAIAKECPQILGTRSLRSYVRCAQFVGHHNMLILPSFLKECDIEFQIIIQRAGQLLYTEPGAYHQVINTGCNVATAINYQATLMDEPDGYVWCVKGKCGTTDSVPLSASSFATSHQTSREF